MHRTIQPAAHRVRVAVLLLLAAATGCSRAHFRIRADKDVEGVITQKNIFPDWKVENWHVYPDPRSRFADPSVPDYPPYPPDDYATWLTSPNPQHPGRGGVGRNEGSGWLKYLTNWDQQNRTEDETFDKRDREIEHMLDIQGRISSFDPDKPGSYSPDDPANPKAAEELSAVAGGAGGYLAAFATTQKPFRIRAEQAVELALFNAREFQDRREDLYLAALPVTLERFNFAAQAFATEQIIRQSTGRDFSGGAGERWQIGTTPGFSRTFATGGELMVRLANQIVVNLSSDSPTTAVSTFSLTFLQPFLQGGGYAVTLEALTQAERTLLYAIRSYARFRHVFYNAIAGGGRIGYTNNPYGLAGLAANLGRGIGANLTAPTIGYLPTILQGAIVANDRRNVAALEQFLRLYQNLKEGGVVSDLQVNQVEQSLLNGRTAVLSDTRQYLDNIDTFKLQLGVPSTVALELDDRPLRPVRQQIQRFGMLFAEFRQLEEAAQRFNPAEAPAAYRQRWARLLTESSLARGTPFAQQYIESATRLQRMTDEALAKDLAALRARHRQILDARAARQLKNVAETPQQEADLDATEAAIDRIGFELALRRYESRPWLAAPAERRAAAQAQAFTAAFEAGILVAIQPRNQRLAKIRTEWPELPPLTVDGCDLLKLPLDEAYTKVAQTALINRLDLMNARAQVVDGWRQVTVTANALQGVFNVQYDLNAPTPSNGANPFAFGGTRTRNTVTLNIQPPFVRRNERNQYRAALIGYQRSRRNLMAFEDNIITDSRQDLRQLRQLAVSYAIQQRTVELGFSLVDSARSTLLAPPDPTVRDTATSAAALTRQLLDAQGSLLQAQNALFTTWITYQAIRMELYLDLDLLRLDAQGLWTNEFAPTKPAPITPAPGGEQRPDLLPAPRPEPSERAPAPQPVPAAQPAAGR